MALIGAAGVFDGATGHIDVQLHIFAACRTIGNIEEDELVV
jgi:hypothetical protein